MEELGKRFYDFGPFRVDPSDLIIAEDLRAHIVSFKVVPFSWSYLSARWTTDGQALIFRDSEIFVSNLWKQPLAGGPPTQLTNFKAELIFNYAVMPNSQHLILSRGQTLSNVVLIKDFR